MSARESPSTSDRGRAVLITGCSSGIGRATALHLARQGLTVFATVRRPEQARELAELGEPDLLPVHPLDMARLEDVAGIARTVEAELARRRLDGLYALVSNAGAGQVAPIELLDPGRFRTELAARVAGPVALLQALLPLIRRARGRVLWIVTPAIVPTPYVSSIHACDFAVNCLARTLDIELQPWAIPSIMIRCGGIRTPAGLRTSADVEAVLAGAPPDRAALYQRALRAWGREMTAFDEKRTDAAEVARLVHRALGAARPRRRYAVGHMSRAAAFLEALPQTLGDRILKRRFRPAAPA